MALDGSKYLLWEYSNGGIVQELNVRGQYGRWNVMRMYGNRVSFHLIVYNIRKDPG
jgi:hypothetical protein